MFFYGLNTHFYFFLATLIMSAKAILFVSFGCFIHDFVADLSFSMLNTCQINEVIPSGVCPATSAPTTKPTTATTQTPVGRFSY